MIRFFSSHFRPISKLDSLSKVLRKFVHSQLLDYLSLNSILEKFQSGFKTRHITESALLRVFNVHQLLLNSSAALDIVEQGIFVIPPTVVCWS